MIPDCMTTLEELDDMRAKQEHDFAHAAQQLHQWVDEAAESNARQLEQRIVASSFTAELADQTRRVLRQLVEERRQRAHCEVDERLAALRERSDASVCVLERHLTVGDALQ